jgi:hypothetical protein
MPGSSRELAEQYLEYARTGDHEAIIAMFADDAVLEPPDRSAIPEVRGIDALRAHYHRSVTTRTPKIEATNWVVDGLRCVVELTASYDDEPGDLRIVDVFSFDKAGKIAHMTAYHR